MSSTQWLIVFLFLVGLVAPWLAVYLSLLRQGCRRG